MALDLPTHPLAVYSVDTLVEQVEQVRLGLDDSVPVCVQQWNGIIACNCKFLRDVAVDMIA